VRAPATDELADLVSRAKAGDRAAFDDLVKATYAEAFTLATRLMGNEEDASDVVQDAYLRAFRAIGRFRGDARFTTWLYRIVANCAATALGRRGRHRHEELDDGVVVVDDHADHDPERKASDAFDRMRLQAALAALPEKLRVVVVLRDVYDLPHEAIATELGITETAAKVRLHRARKKLRVRLFPLHDEVDGPAAGEEEVRGAG
jgi:RNA polymerase sigma-70 factor (ECF subfamily)